MDDPEPNQALELIDSGLFSHGDRKLSLQLTQSLRLHEPYLVCADFRAYLDCQEDMGRC
jgi:starch phosphorylase